MVYVGFKTVKAALILRYLVVVVVVVVVAWPESQRSGESLSPTYMLCYTLGLLMLLLLLMLMLVVW